MIWPGTIQHENGRLSSWFVHDPVPSRFEVQYMKNPSRVPAVEADWINAPAKKADAIKKGVGFLGDADLFCIDRFFMALVGSDW